MFGILLGFAPAKAVENHDGKWDRETEAESREGVFERFMNHDFDISIT